MKKILGILVITVIGVMSFSSCDPIENREEMKGSVTEAEVKAKVIVESVVRDGKKSNYIHLSSDGLADCVTSFQHGLGTYVGTNATVQGFVVPGDFTVIVNVLNADGTMLPPIPFPVTVEECFDVAPEWEIFCGSGEKVWTWDTEAPAYYGNGGYLSNIGPGWWQVSDYDSQGGLHYDGEGEGATMTFSASGAKLIKDKTTGSTESGTFSFDMSKTKTNADGDALWAIGQLNTTGIVVLNGWNNDDGGGKPVNVYDILKLTDDQMILGNPVADAGAWGTCFYWVFKAK